MLFGILNGLPYYVANGRAYPVSISADGKTVDIDFKNGSIAECSGVYTVAEILAKCENLNSIPEPKRRRVRKNVL